MSAPQENIVKDAQAQFEDWYVQNAFDYAANPIGSRDCGLMRRAWHAALAAAIPHLHPQPAELSFDVDAMLAACVPGGSIVDPQVVADNIRAWVADRMPAELAEQQGVELANQWRHVFDGDGHDMAGANKNTLRRFIQVIDALAPTGIGEAMRSDLSGYAVAASQVRRGYEVECERCGTFCDTGPGPCHQVGEVQGDARAPAEIAAVLRAMAINYAHGHVWDHLDAEVCREAADALAARQPKAQEQPSFGQVREIRIPARNKLDPISVFVQDQAAGRGRIVVTCYGNAWQGFWNAMGDRTVMQFVAKCDPDYVAGSMLQGRQTRIAKHDRDYATRIAAEVIAEFRTLIDDQRDAAPGVGNG